MPTATIKQFWMDSSQWPTPTPVAPTVTRGVMGRRRRVKPREPDITGLYREYLMFQMVKTNE